MDKTNIHNNFFVSILKKGNNARDFLIEALPKAVSDKLDLNHIEFCNTSYIQERFEEFFSDVVIRTRISGTPADIYILTEHKSSLPGKNALFLQILSYIYSMLEEDYKNNKDFRIVIPLVFYHGSAKWSIPNEFVSLYKTDNVFKEFILNFRYFLYDTVNFDPDKSEKLHNNLILTSSLIALKSAFDRNDIDSVKRVIKNLNESGALSSLLDSETFLIYIITAVRMFI